MLCRDRRVGHWQRLRRMSISRASKGLCARARVIILLSCMSGDCTIIDSSWDWKQ